MSAAPRPLVDEPLPLPRRWGKEELARLARMVEQPALFYWKGPQTEALLEEFRRHYPLRHAFPTSSGTAAIHVAIAALRLAPGDEVIVPPITDMGTVIGILYQQGVPVFCDLDSSTYNLAPQDVARKITAKTRAILAVHLAGNPCDLAALSALAKQHGLALVEDCAQAWGAQWQGRPVGLHGDLACFSFNDYKHLSCGDGGIVATNASALGEGLGKWGDKNYDRTTGSREPDELAPNYRISEPQAAVAAAQLTKLPAIADARSRSGTLLSQLLAGAPGLSLPRVASGDTHSYWFYLLRMEAAYFRVDREQLAAELIAEGVPCTAGYIPKPLYRYAVFSQHAFFGGRWPIREFGLTSMDYRQVHCPVAEAIIADSIKVTINEAMSAIYVEKVAAAIRAVAARHTR